MAISQPPHSAAVTLLIAPECEVPDCSVGGDQYSMVRCLGCKAWFHTRLTVGQYLDGGPERVTRVDKMLAPAE